MRFSTISAALFATLLAAATAASAEDRSTILLLDGSGSMWGRFEVETEKRAKIDVVRELLKPIVTSATQSRIGLVSFGHRRKGDCSDVEVIAAPATDHATILSTIEKLNPKGKGPLAEGLRQAAAALGTAKPAAIVAITDGTDNCRQDACAAASEIAKGQPGLAIHVVSIGVDPIDLPRMQCIAKETGGKFYDVRDAISLAASIAEATSLALSSPAPVAEAPGAVSAAAPTPAQIAGASLMASAVLAPGAPPLAMPAHWRIEKTGTDEPARHIEAAQIAENLPPGTYDIEVEVGGHTAKSQVSIEAGRPHTIALPLDAARLNVTVKGRDITEGGAAPLITVSSHAPEGGAVETVWIGRKTGIDALLAPGAYRVAVSNGETRQERELTLTLGQETAAEFTLATGRIALSAVAKEGADILRDVTFAISEDDPDSPDGRRELLRSGAPEPEFTLPAGTYYVTARSGSAEVRQRIALSPGSDVRKSLVMPAAHLGVTAQIAGLPPAENAGLVYRIYSLDGEPKEVARSTQPRFNAMLNAGKYRAVASLDAHAAWAAQDILIEPGKPAEIVLRIESGEITFKPPSLASALVPGEAFWEVSDANAKPVWHGTAAEPKVLLAPGRYTVRLEVRDIATEAAFEVKSGEKRLVELGAH